MSQDIKVLTKKKVPAIEVDYPIQAVAANMLDILDMRQDEKGSYLNSYRVRNRMDEPLIIMDEFGNKTTLNSDPIRMTPHVAIFLNNSKCKIEGAEGKSIYLNIDKKFFRDYPAIYVRELNIVVGLAASFEYYDIYHPYGIHSYSGIVKNHLEVLTDTLTSLSFTWWINEPKLTSNSYYMNFGSEIISIPKINMPNDKTTFSLVCPDGDLSNSTKKYRSKEYDLTELEKKDKLTFQFDLGNDSYSFCISTDPAVIEREIEQRKKNVRNIVTRSDHETLVKTIEARCAREVGDAELKAEEKYQNIVQELTNKVTKLSEENALMKTVVEKSEKLTSMYAKFHTSEADIHQAQAKSVSAKTSVTKEKISIWSDAIKYGLGGLVALATILITKFAKSK